MPDPTGLDMLPADGCGEGRIADDKRLLIELKLLLKSVDCPNRDKDDN